MNHLLYYLVPLFPWLFPTFSSDHRFSATGYARCIDPYTPRYWTHPPDLSGEFLEFGSCELTLKH